MSQIQKKFIKDQAVDESKILLLNDGALKARNAANSADVSLLKLDGTDILKLLKLPRVDSALAAPSDAKDLATKEYVDNEITDNVTNQLGAANGIATLDGSGRIPSSQLTIEAFEYKGSWSAATNTPSLADGVGNTGDVYHVSAAGSQDLGSGSIAFVIGDKVVYNGTIWEKWDLTDAVSSVNGETGAVTLTAGDIGMDVNVQGQSDVQAVLEELDSLIQNLEAASVQFVQEKFVLSAGDISNGYVTLANLAIAASINAYVDRLAIHQTDDYTLSTVGGVTRITFAGSLVSPGQENLSANDVIRVKYAKVAIL
jgi:hypothetical protein